MATLKFKKPSPYTTLENGCPKEDTIYLHHIEDLKMENPVIHKQFGVAIFGIGRAGTIHLSYLVNLRRVKLLYVVDDDVEKLKRIKSYFNLPDDVNLITNSEASRIYNDPEVRFVVCCTPTFTHENIIIKALKANKAVFCEKPIAETTEATKAIYDLAENVGQPLFSAFNRRFDPTYASLRERVRSGEIGQALVVKVCSRDSPLPSLDYLKISGGIFHDCAVHDIDMILHCIGELPCQVSSLANANIPEIKAIDDFDTVAIIMSFPSGAVASIDLSRQCSYGYDQRLEVFGQTGMLKAENISPTQSLEEFKNDSVKRPPIDYSFASRYAEAYRKEIDHFLDVLEGKVKLLVTGKELLAVSKIATAAEEAARTGKVVKLAWSNDEFPDYS